MATISIVVPVYNGEKYVEKCLGSLCGQTFADLEIICVDDASSDRSLEIVMHMAKTDSRIQVIRHSENMGTLRARKHGVEKAAGNTSAGIERGKLGSRRETGEGTEKSSD